MNQALQKPWYQLDPGAGMASAIVNHVLVLKGQDNGKSSVAGRRTRLASQRAMYLDRVGPMFGGEGDQRSKKSPYPVITGALDSVHSKITTTRPRPQIVAIGGRWKAGRKATLLQRWIDGFYDQEGVYTMMANMVQDAMIYDAAWVKVYGEQGKVKLERVWDGDLYIDPQEERFPPVRTLYHVLAVDRQALIQRFPKHKRAIERANSAPIRDIMPFGDLATGSSGRMFVDMVVLIETWRLGSGKKNPGQHVAAIAGEILHHAEYTSPDFPFASYIWARDPERFRGQSFMERGAEVQLDLDDHASVMRDAYRFFVPRWVRDATSDVKISQLADEIGVLTWNGVGQGVDVLAPPAVSPDFVQREEMLKARLFQVTGASELEATSMVQPNLSSGRAILAHQDATSIRFLPQGRGYEETSRRLACLVMEVADGLATDEKASIEVYGTEYGAELIDYRDVMLGQDEYTIRVFPASKLPDTIAGRQEIIGQMMDREMITDPIQAMRLMDMPDLEGHHDLATARRRYADRMIDRCLDGEQGLPTKDMGEEGLVYALDRAQIVLCDALSRDGDEDDPEAMECLRMFIGATNALLNPPAPPEPAVGPVEAMPPDELPPVDEMPMDALADPTQPANDAGLMPAV